MDKEIEAQREVKQFVPGQHSYKAEVNVGCQGPGFNTNNICCNSVMTQIQAVPSPASPWLWECSQHLLQDGVRLKQGGSSCLLTTAVSHSLTSMLSYPQNYETGKYTGTLWYQKCFS